MQSEIQLGRQRQFEGPSACASAGEAQACAGQRGQLGHARPLCVPAAASIGTYWSARLPMYGKLCWPKMIQYTAPDLQGAYAGSMWGEKAKAVVDELRAQLSGDKILEADDWLQMDAFAGDIKCILSKRRKARVDVDRSASPPPKAPCARTVTLASRSCSGCCSVCRHGGVPAPHTPYKQHY